MKRLIILRGLPGSGKSTLAKELVERYSNLGYVVRVLSTDSKHFVYTEEGWKYVFQPQNLSRFHKENIYDAEGAMRNEVDVIIIDNTNTTWSEIKPYALLALVNDYEIEIVESNTPWRFNIAELTRRNTHGVPIEAIRKMLARWQSSDIIKATLKALKDV